MDIQTMLEKMVDSWKIAHYFDRKFMNAGYSDNPYMDISARIADAIYSLLGEETETFEESFTCRTLKNKAFSVKECAAALFREHERRVALDYIEGRRVV